ncbi:Mannose or cellobiose epimerase, N-acyl-D-glucosamine 2-epimerase family [Daejeonella lutea]|uniref:Mannose or cellobiose epimerase, N-acyl-D-glucosamine 2-epimerase family n=2 Tax=Daejeonella lutea TaxID=572036 RepID=A0A1T5AA09_9SPHI|nr:Mannose or cellobiose epimerase, N-acyl-D-glucosamine 2-epimerase family [Daejeonella lutea]
MSGAVIAGLSNFSISGCNIIKPESVITSDNQYAFGGKDFGAMLATVRNKYHSDLFDKFLPNMDSLVIDHEYGGFNCAVDIVTRRQLGTNKSAWFEGRGLWTYSFLYNNLGKNPKYLEVARKSKDLILKLKPADNSFWPTSFTREGKALSGPGDIYTGLFIAEGLAEYAKASGESEYRDLAKKIVMACLARFDSPSYDYYVAYLNPEAPKVPAPRVVGHWMVFLRAATQMLETGPDPEIEKLADRCLDALLNHHLNPEYHLFNEVLNHDFSRPQNSFGDFAYMGHGIETCWMMIFEAARRKDQELFSRTAKIFKRHVTVAHDTVFGGYFRSLDNVSNNIWKVDKVLWLQEEILIGTLFLAEHTGDAWAQNCFKETLGYVNKNFDRPGYAFWPAGGDRLMKEHQKNRAEHYHHPRHLMLNLLALNRIIARKGKISGLFI